MVTTNVRMASVDDAVELSRLNHEFNGGERVDPSVIRERIKNSTELVAVANLGERLVGFACAQSFHSFCYSNAHGEITEMYVEETARRMGLASLMIGLLEEELVQQGVTSIKILTGKENEAAIRTYIGNNYNVEDEVILEKKVK